MGEVRIRDRGRGPELERIRITVYDLLPHFQDGWHHSTIAMLYSISSAEVLALQQYYEVHKDEVLAMWEKIQQRIAKGNPPEVEAKLVASRAKLQAMREKLRQQKKSGEDNERYIG